MRKVRVTVSFDVEMEHAISREDMMRYLPFLGKFGSKNVRFDRDEANIKIDKMVDKMPRKQPQLRHDTRLSIVGPHTTEDAMRIASELKQHLSQFGYDINWKMKCFGRYGYAATFCVPKKFETQATIFLARYHKK